MILSIDSGTTGTTVLVLDARGRVAGQAYEELPQHFPKPGWVEHDPREILRVALRVIGRALQRARVPAAKLAAIGITNQRETVVVWDRASGRPVANAIVWQCRRSAPICDALKRRGLEPQFRRKTGLLLDPYFSGTKLRWYFDHMPGLTARARQGKLAFGTVDSWLLWQLTGGAVHATDTTNASRTLLFNIGTGRWDPSLLKLLGIPSSMLPEVRPPSGVFGRTARVGPLPAGIPIAGIAGDQQASMVGHACLKPGEGKNTYGTGCFLLVHTGTKPVPSRHGLLTTIAYGTSPGLSYALEGSVFIAGAAIQWLRDALRVVERAADTEAIARKLRDTGGVYVVPAFVGLGAPYWDSGARGAIVGLTRGSTREAIIRATLESLAYQTRDVVEAMERDSGIRLRRLQVDGGAAQNDWLMQFQADILGIDVVRPASVANTARGAAFLAGMGVGLWSPSQLRALAGSSVRTFRPSMGTAQRRQLYDGWLEAVGRVSSRDRHS